MTDGAHDHPEILAAIPTVPPPPDLSPYATHDEVAAMIAAALQPAGPPPVTPAPALKSLAVKSIVDALSAAVDDTLDEIVVANGTYAIAPASAKAANSIWIGAKYAKRTRPLVIRPATPGGARLDGGGAAPFGAISFEDGATQVIWQGFEIANGTATETGVITFGGYAGLPGAHHVGVRDLRLLASLKGTANNANTPANDHAVYFSEAVGGPHDLLLEDLDIDCAGGLAAGFHVYHSDAKNVNAWNVTARRIHIRNAQQALMLCDSTMHDWLLEDVDIATSSKYAVRWDQFDQAVPWNPQNMVLRRVIANGTKGTKGVVSTTGASKAGLTLDSCVLA